MCVFSAFDKPASDGGLVEYPMSSKNANLRTIIMRSIYRLRDKGDEREMDVGIFPPGDSRLVGQQTLTKSELISDSAVRF